MKYPENHRVKICVDFSVLFQHLSPRLTTDLLPHFMRKLAVNINFHS